MNKIKLLTIIFLIVGFLIPCQTVSADDSSDFSTNISISENENTDCYDIDIEVYNSGKNFTGNMELQIGDGGYYSNSVIYAAAVSVPEKSTKVVHFSVPRSITTDYTFNVSIAIKNDRKKVVHSNVFNSPLKSANTVFNVGILSNNPEALNYMDLSGKRVWIKTGEFSIKHNVLKASSIEEDIFSQKAVIINDYDTSTLTQDEINVIKRYVDNGGILILGTGTDLNTLKGFDSSFTDVNGSNGTLPIVLSFSSNEATNVTGQNLDVNYNGYSFYTNFGDCGYIVQRGKGAVLTLYMNPADKNMQAMTKDDIEVFVSSLYDSAMANTQFLTDSGELSFQSGYYGITDYMDKPPSGAISAIVPILIVYILLIGPVLYIILKKFDKREKCWVIIPGIAFVFTFFIFLLSISIAVNNMNMKSIKIREADSTSVVTYVTGYSPKSDTWTINFDEKYYTACYADRHYYNNSKTYVTNSAGGVSVSYSPESVFDEAAFTVYGKEDKIGDFGGVENITFDGLKLKGKIKNNTGMDLDYIAIMYGGNISVISNVKNGEEADISGKVLFSDNSNYGTGFMRKQISQAYDNGEYDVSSELSALSIAMDAAVFSPAKDYTNKPIVIGVTKSENVINMKNGEESSFTCVYMD